MCADDLTVYATVNNDSEKVKFQNELDKFCKRCSDWALLINFKKCKLHFGYNNKKINVT